MIEYTFTSNSDYSTKKIIDLIKTFNPTVKFELNESHFGLCITCHFESENIRDSFIATIGNSLGVNDDGIFLK